MLGVFLLVVFFLPGLLGFVLWPKAGQADYWKIVAIMSGGSLFVALKATYAYFTLLLVERESKLGMYD